jgi:hypothetical protein
VLGGSVGGFHKRFRSPVAHPLAGISVTVTIKKNKKTFKTTNAFYHFSPYIMYEEIKKAA